MGTQAVDDLEAGRELDDLVADKVMLWYGKYGTRSDQDVPPPHYSTDIAAACQVVDQLAKQGIAVMVSNYGLVNARTVEKDVPSTQSFVILNALPDTRPVGERFALAICRAALKATLKP